MNNRKGKKYFFIAVNGERRVYKEKLLFYAERFPYRMLSAVKNFFFGPSSPFTFLLNVLFRWKKKFLLK